MTIQFTCVCGQLYQVADQFGGKHTKCKQCHELIQIPFSPVPPSVVDAPGAPQSVTAGSSTYEPQLTKRGKSKSMGNLAVRGELKQLKSVQLVSSDIYKVGESRSFMQRLKDSAIVGPMKFSETSVDSLQLFRFQDAMGEFAAVVPFDNGMIAPVEYVAKLPAPVSHSIALLKQSGGNVGLTAGALVGGPLGALIAKVGTDVDSIWAGCDGDVPPLAELAQQQPALRAGIRWDGKIGGGPVTEVHHLGWGAQLLSLDDQSSLLVAQSVPRQKMLGLEFGISWFHAYRKSIARFVEEANSNASGDFQFVDPGVWLAAVIEVFGWVSPGQATTA